MKISDIIILKVIIFLKVTNLKPFFLNKLAIFFCLNIYIRDICIRSSYTRNIYARNTCIKDTYINRADIKNIYINNIINLNNYIYQGLKEMNSIWVNR